MSTGIANGARMALIVGVTAMLPIGALGYSEAVLPTYAILDTARRLAWTVPFGVAVAAVELTILWPVTRGSPLRLLAGMYVAIYAPVVAFLVAGVMNVALDRAPATEQEARVVRHDRPRKGPSAIVVTSWRSPGDEESVRDLGPSPSSAPPGSVVRVTAHPGALGLAWVSAVRPR